VLAGVAVGTEGLPIRPTATPASTDKQPYAGPTIGLNNRVRRAPQIGYRWTFD